MYTKMLALSEIVRGRIYPLKSLFSKGIHTFGNDISKRVMLKFQTGPYQSRSQLPNIWSQCVLL